VGVINLKYWKGSPQSILLVIALLMAISILPTLSGCVNDPGSPLSRVLNVVSHGSPLPQEAARELERFNQVYQKYAISPDKDQFDYFTFAFRQIRSKYVHQITDMDLINAGILGVENAEVLPGTMEPAKLVEVALDSITASLDPHSAYMNGEEYRESFLHIKGEFGGLGIEVTMEDGFVKVISPIEDTPAARSNLKSGDLITHVDGEPIKGNTLWQAVKKMRGKPGTDISIKVRREGVADFDIVLTRSIITVRAVKWRMEGDIGYVRVSGFTEPMEKGVITAFRSLRSEYGRDPKGIVLDLRSNPGGLLDQSIVLSDSFLERGEIVSVRGRHLYSSSSFIAESGDLANGVPMVLLINEGSASASEIVASALKFHKRATIMGRQSFGKGSVQSIIALPVDGALKLTTALYYGPDGKTLQAYGVAPDIILEIEKTDKETHLKIYKESDNPNAIAAKSDEERGPQSTISVSTCKEVGERKDKELGCAISYLQAISPAKFLAKHARYHNM
jgi:carboxyl-terminal processing protease